MIERAIILPFGENFNKNNTGAAGLFVKESLNNKLYFWNFFITAT